MRSFEAAVRGAEQDVPIAYVPYEVINQWGDQGWRHPSENPYNGDIYDAAEVEALVWYQEVLDQVSRAIPDDYPPLIDVQATPEWQLLRDTAEHALGVLMKRGKFPEDREIV